MTKSADFWKKSYDKKYGGYYTRVGIDGVPYDNNLKST